MEIEDIRRVLIVGAGAMGCQIGLQCAVHGYDVILYDIAPDKLQAATTQIKSYADGFASSGLLTQEQTNATLNRITMAEDPKEAADDVDLLSESVPENPELKGKVFAQFNELCPPHTVFTTNSSYLIPSMFAQDTGRPTQFAALHFHPYVWDTKLVDIMPHPGTSKETVELLKAFAKRIGQMAIVLEKENYGYVFNAMLNSLNREALTLVVNGVASFEDVDRSWMLATKMTIGPFGGADLIGLDLCWQIADYWGKRLFDTQLQSIAAFLKKEYVDKSWLGMKSGKGFYTYPNPVYEQPAFLAIE
jgi:3-hydroxybutyryl-CoA dehydrogenase